MTNEELVKIYQENKEPGILEIICNKNKGLIFSVVRDFRSVYAGEGTNQAAIIESDDLIQDGYIGLIQAVKNYNSEKCAAFSTFAVINIKAVIMRGLDDRGHILRIPAYKRQQINHMNKFRMIYKAEHGHEPKINNICEFMRLDITAVKELQKFEMLASVKSINSPLNEKDEGELCDIIPDKSNTIEEVEESIFYEQAKKKLWGIVDSLGTDQAAVIRKYYHEHESLKEISEGLSISVQRATQTKNNALNNLRKKARTNELRALADGFEIADSVSYSGVGFSSFARTMTSATERAAMLRVETAAKIGKRIERREKFSGAGLSRTEQGEYYKILMNEQQEYDRQRIAELKNEF